MSSVTDINKGCPTAHRPKDSSKSKIDSDQPETVYNWLDEF